MLAVEVLREFFSNASVAELELEVRCGGVIYNLAGSVVMNGIKQTGQVWVTGGAVGYTDGYENIWGGVAVGGLVYTCGGTVLVDASSFLTFDLFGGYGGGAGGNPWVIVGKAGGDAVGGAIAVFGGSCNVENSTFDSSYSEVSGGMGGGGAE